MWFQRVNDAKPRLDFASNYMGEIEDDCSGTDIPPSDHHYAHQTGLSGENLALVEYNLVLRIYADLTVRGIIPDEAEWLKSQGSGRER